MPWSLTAIYGSFQMTLNHGSGHIVNKTWIGNLCPSLAVVRDRRTRQRRIRIQGCATVEYGTAAVTGRRGSQASSFGKRNLTKKCYLNRLYEELKQAKTIKRD